MHLGSNIGPHEKLHEVLKEKCIDSIIDKKDFVSNIRWSMLMIVLTLVYGHGNVNIFWN